MVGVRSNKSKKFCAADNDGPTRSVLENRKNRTKNKSKINGFTALR